LKFDLVAGEKLKINWAVAGCTKFQAANIGLFRVKFSLRKHILKTGSLSIPQKKTALFRAVL